MFYQGTNSCVRRTKKDKKKEATAYVTILNLAYLFKDGSGGSGVKCVHNNGNDDGDGNIGVDGN